MRAGYERVKDAAESLGIKPVTYRTYEHGKADGGREPTLSELQRICRKFKVSWVWVATAQGSPDDGAVLSDRAAEADQKISQIPEDKRDDAWNAVMGVLEAYRKRA